MIIKIASLYLSCPLQNTLVTTMLCDHLNEGE